MEINHLLQKYKKNLTRLEKHILCYLTLHRKNFMTTCVKACFHLIPRKCLAQTTMKTRSRYLTIFLPHRHILWVPPKNLNYSILKVKSTLIIGVTSKNNFISLKTGWLVIGWSEVLICLWNLQNVITISLAILISYKILRTKLPIR